MRERITSEDEQRLKDFITTIVKFKIENVKINF